MFKYPDSKAYIFNFIFVDLRAMQLADVYDLPYKRVRRIMRRTVIKEPIQAEIGFFDGEIDSIVRELNFEPSLPEALRFLNPMSALLLFENEDKEEIASLMKTLNRLFTPLFSRMMYQALELGEVQIESGG